MFDTTKEDLKSAHEGRLQLPDFQRDYVWGDEDERDVMNDYDEIDDMEATARVSISMCISMSQMTRHLFIMPSAHSAISGKDWLQRGIPTMENGLDHLMNTLRENRQRHPGKSMSGGADIVRTGFAFLLTMFESESYLYPIRPQAGVVPLIP